METFWYPFFIVYILQIEYNKIRQYSRKGVE